MKSLIFLQYLIFFNFIFPENFFTLAQTPTVRLLRNNNLNQDEISDVRDLPPIRLQSGNFGTVGVFPSVEYSNRGNYPNAGGGRGISPLGLNYFGLIAQNGLSNGCSICSTADYSYAQKCCSFGFTNCCNPRANARPVLFNNGGYSSSWRPSTGVTYDSQFSSQGGFNFNQRDKPGNCYFSSSSRGGYSDLTSGGQSYGSHGSGGYSHGIQGGNGIFPQGSSRQYCRTDFECIGTQKCCGNICSNPSYDHLG